MQKPFFPAKTYPILLYLPSDYDTAESWPTILYLHGMGAKGNYLEILKAHGLPRLLEKKDNFPFIVISPQCPENEEWSVALLADVLNETARQFRIDPDRIYLTGIGTGASATWELAIAQPERFAAIAPICGSGSPNTVCALRDLPVWAFHGAKDKIIPISEAQGMILALKLCGGDVTFTVYPEAGHDSWTEAYNDPELYSWFLENRRLQFREPVPDPAIADLD